MFRYDQNVVKTIPEIYIINQDFGEEQSPSKKRNTIE